MVLARESVFRSGYIPVGFILLLLFLLLCCVVLLLLVSFLFMLF